MSVALLFLGSAFTLKLVGSDRFSDALFNLASGLVRNPGGLISVTNDIQIPSSGSA